MKRKKLWIALLTLAVLAPTLILCVLMLTSDDFSLDDFADCSSLSVVYADGQTVELKEGEENFVLLTRILSIAQTSKTAMDGSLATRLYTVKSGDGDAWCYLGIESGQAAVEWKGRVYVLSYPHLQSADTAMHPRLVRYGVQTENGYIDAPILSQSTDVVYSIGSAQDFSAVSFDRSCEPSSLEILLYAQGSKNASRVFSAFDEVVFNESQQWTIVVNVELVQDTYRVQCGYEFFYSPNG